MKMEHPRSAIGTEGGCRTVNGGEGARARGDEEHQQHRTQKNDCGRPHHHCIQFAVM